MLQLETWRSISEISRAVTRVRAGSILRRLLPEIIAGVDDLAALAQALNAEVDANPGHPNALSRRGVVAFALDLHDCAIADFEAAAEGAERGDRPAEQAEFLHMVATSYLCLENLEEAARYFRRSLDIDPDHRNSLIELAFLQHRFERFDEARALYRQYLQIDPAAPEAMLNYLILLLKEVRYEEADEALQAYQKAGGRDSDVAIQAVHLSVHFGVTESVMRLVQAALIADPMNGDLWHAQFSLSSALNDAATAVASAQRAAHLRSDLRFQSYRRHTPFNA